MQKLKIFLFKILYVFILSFILGLLYGIIGIIILFPLSILGFFLGGFKSILLLFEVYAILGFTSRLLICLEEVLE